MGVSKSSQFSQAETEAATFAKALAHPARIAILRFLLENGQCICGDIVEVLPLSQSTVSQHLKELKQAGLIKGSVDPPRVCYCIDPVVWEHAGKVLASVFGKGLLGCC